MEDGADELEGASGAVCAPFALSPQAHPADVARGLADEDLERAIVAATLAGNHDVAALLGETLRARRLEGADVVPIDARRRQR